MGLCGCVTVVVAVLAVTAAAGEVDIEVDEDVFVLTSSTFDAWIASQPLALVEFYALWYAGWVLIGDAREAVCAR
jgi:hypothetical protein